MNNIEPVAWVRYRSDGGFEGPIMDTDARMCDTRRSFWTPLYAAPLANEASKPAPSVEQDERGDAPLSLIPELVKQDQRAVGDALLDMGDAMVAWRTEVGKYREITSLAQSAFSDGYEAGIAAILRARAASTPANVAQGDALSAVASDIASMTADDLRAEHESHRNGDIAVALRELSANVAQGAVAKLEFMPVDSMQHAIVYGSTEAIGALKARMERDYRAALNTASPADPCPQCIPGGVCKTPTCGRLRARANAAPPAQTALTDEARECLMDVVSHHHDFRTACLEIKMASETTVSDELYWQKQIDVLDRMKGQAERALTAAQSASGDTK